MICYIIFIDYIYFHMGFIYMSQASMLIGPSSPGPVYKRDPKLAMTLTADVLALIYALSARQNGHPFPGDIFKWIFLNEDVWISIEFSLNFAPRGPINKITALVQIMAWRRPGDRPLSEPMMVILLTHTCATRPQSVKSVIPSPGMLPTIKWRIYS